MIASSSNVYVRQLPLARRLVIATAATMLFNGFNFALGLLLVRHLAPRSFGVWAMLTTVQAIASALLTALIAQPMAYSLPRMHHPARRRASARHFASVAAWLIAAFVPATAVTLHALDLPTRLVVAGSAFVAATGVRAYARVHLYAWQRPRAVLAQDAVFVALGAGGVALVGWREDLTALLLALTLANVAALARHAPPRPALRPRQLRRHLAAYRRHGARAWWSLVAMSLSTLSVLSPNLALASTGSLAALAVVAAPVALLAPLRLVALTFQASLRAEFSALVGAGRTRAAAMLYAAASAAALLACLSLAALLWGAWDWLGPRVFARGYDPASLRHATLFAFGIASVNAVRLPGAVLLNALGVFRFSAVTLTVVAPVVLASAMWLAHRGAIVAVLYPALGGEIAMFAAETCVLLRLVR